MKAGLLFVVLPLCVGINVQAASFDCAKATTKVEKLICADPELSKLDEEMADLYKKTLATSPIPDDYQPHQNWWLQKRNRCEDAACIQKLYSWRTTYLRMDLRAVEKHYNTGGPRYPAGYIMTQGKGYLICDAYKKQLDTLGKIFETDFAEGQQLVWKIPGIEEAAWQDLDVETNLDLFELLIRYFMLPYAQQGQARSHADRNMSKPLSEKQLEENKEKSKDRIAQWREEARAGKLKLQILHVEMIHSVDDKPETIARIRRKRGPGKYEYGNIMYPVSDDLKEIALQKLNWANWDSGGELVFYKGRHYVIAPGHDALIRHDFGSGFLPFCTIEFDTLTNINSKKGKK